MTTTTTTNTTTRDAPLTRDVVLSGSGAKLFAFVGALRALDQRGVAIGDVCGCSGGALIASLFAAFRVGHTQTEAIEALEREALTINPIHFLTSNVMSVQPWQGKFNAGRVRSYLTGKLAPSFDALPGLHVVTHNLSTGVPRTWRKGDKVEPARAVTASMSIPLIFDMQEIEGHWHVDGGISSNYPLPVFSSPTAIGIRFRAWAPTKARRLSNRLDVLSATIDDMIESCDRNAASLAPHATTIYLDVQGDSLDFDVDIRTAKAMIEAGYASTYQQLP